MSTRVACLEISQICRCLCSFYVRIEIFVVLWELLRSFLANIRIFVLILDKVVGAIDQMDVDDSEAAEKNSGSGVDAKNNAEPNKGKGKRKLYVGTQSLGFRRDHMEVS